MRRGEKVKLRWSRVHLQEGYLELPASITKTGSPASCRSISALSRSWRPSLGVVNFFFDTNVNTVKLAFRRARERAGCVDMRERGTKAPASCWKRRTCARTRLGTSPGTPTRACSSATTTNARANSWSGSGGRSSDPDPHRGRERQPQSRGWQHRWTSTAASTACVRPVSASGGVFADASRRTSGRIIDGVWNLELACQSCNREAAGNVDRLPTERLPARLHARNEHLIVSHHPLRETLIVQTGDDKVRRSGFLRDLYTRGRQNCGRIFVTG